MTYEEAIIIIRRLWCFAHIDCPDEKVREALDIAKEAIEKQIPKKVIWRSGCDGLPLAYCSACGKSVMHSDYCDNCGQKLEF